MKNQFKGKSKNSHIHEQKYTNECTNRGRTFFMVQGVNSRGFHPYTGEEHFFYKSVESYFALLSIIYKLQSDESSHRMQITYTEEVCHRPGASTLADSQYPPSFELECGHAHSFTCWLRAVLGAGSGLHSCSKTVWPKLEYFLSGFLQNQPYSR